MTEANSTDSDLADAQGLGTLSAGADLELDVLAFVEAAVALAFDVGVVDEDVFATGYGDESVALFGVEKLHSAARHDIPFAFVEHSRTMPNPAWW